MPATKKNTKLYLLLCFVFVQASFAVSGNSRTNFYGEKTIPGSLSRDTSDFLKNLMLSKPEFFSNYIDSANEFGIQIIYTQINRDKQNKPSFRLYSYRVDENKYFCPASTTKLPVMLLALEKINKLQNKGIDKYTAMRFENARPCQTAASKDTVATDSILSVAHFIEKILLVSDNNSYNRLYEFVGPRAINKRLKQMGFEKAHIVQRFFTNCDANENRYTNPVSFVDENGKVLYHQNSKKSRKLRNPYGKVLVGNSYVSDNGKYINEPKDLTDYNALSLMDLHNIFFRAIFPDAFKEKEKFQIKNEDYPFLYKYMCMLPRESEFVKYHDSIRFPDNRKKYFLYGTDSCKSITNDSLRIFNIVGWLTGYLTDCAYIVDFKNNVEFVLTATIYNNPSGIFDGAHYRYNTLGLPFLRELGQLVYNYELSRTRENKPDLNYLKNSINRNKQ